MLKPASPSGCRDCRTRAVCLARDLGPRELARLDAIIQAKRTVKRGESLYRANDPFYSIYAVYAGSFKTVIAHGDGEEQVTGFHLPGEPLGLDGICTARHNCTAIALEDSTVCIIPFALLESLCREVSAMQHQVHRMMSGEIVRESGLMMVLGAMSAEQRLQPPHEPRGNGQPARNEARNGEPHVLEVSEAAVDRHSGQGGADS
jgi:CRP/FNR family transcriptional regulator